MPYWYYQQDWKAFETTKFWSRILSALISDFRVRFVELILPLLKIGKMTSINGVVYYFWILQDNCLKASFLDRYESWKEIKSENPLFCGENTTELITGAVAYTQSACPSSENDYC